jgi:hypothetical protein
MATLDWASVDGGVDFWCSANGLPVHIDEWALLPTVSTMEGRPARLGSLLGLRDEGIAEERQAHRLHLPWSAIAGSSPATLLELGLPPASPYTLKISKEGLITDPDFKVNGTFVAAGGRPLIGARREGALLSVGRLKFTLLEPAFGVLEAADGLAKGSPALDDRGKWLSLIQERLPADALADPYVRQLRVSRADTVSVLPIKLPNGETSFKIVPARLPRRSNNSTADDSEEPSRVLPEAREDDWNRYLEEFDDRACLPAGSGHYVVATDGVRVALRTLKRLRNGPEPDRIAFLRNPRAAIRAELGDKLEEPALEDLFWESGEYGARVREIGIWQPKVLPFIKRKGEHWLPEGMGLRVGDQLIDLQSEEVPALLQKLQEAKAAGLQQVAFKGQSIPTTDESLDAVRQLLDAAVPKAVPSKPVSGSPEVPGKLTVLIDDNLEELKFKRERRAVEGQVGDLPLCLTSALFPFQMDGYRWLQGLWTAGAPGGLLADDMGLGKTVQALAFLAWSREQMAARKQQSPILIVGPTGLLRNWRDEHDKHLSDGGLGECVEAHGQGLAELRPHGWRGNELPTGVAALDVGRLQRADWVMTTYETLRDYQHSFARVRWGVAVFDEAQKIKNPSALMTDAAKAVDAQFVLTLTGTPVENHLADLWSIVDTAQPGRLGALKTFVQDYPPDAAEKLNSLKYQLAEADPPPLMLRRMKEQCLEGLPSLKVEVRRTEMPSEQADAYDRVVHRARGRGGQQGAMLSALHDLRAVSLHPRASLDGSDDDFVSASARLKATVAILDDIEKRGEKALIFVESLAMQGVLVELLQRRYRLKSPPPIINGSVAGFKRKGRVDVFNSRPGFDLMLLSPRAGGVGLTITSANHVIHLSRWWNPAVEDQATDRVYRIGQERPVHVHVPLAVHPTLGDATFDIRLDALLNRKRSLSRGLLAPATASERDLNQLFQETVEGTSTLPD